MTASRRHLRTSRGPARRRAGPLLACAAVLLAGLAPAPAAAVPREGSISASAGLLHVGYEERGPSGAFLDSEDGWLPSLGARAGLRGWRLAGELSGRLATGDLSYLGQYGAGADHLARSTSAARFLEGTARAGVLLGPGGRAVLLAGAGARRWDRRIHDTTVTSGGAPLPVRGLVEVYRWLVLEGALRVAVVETPRLTWLAEARILQTLSPRLVVEWNGVDVPLDLRPRAGWGAATSVEVTVRPRVFVGGAVALEGYRFGASAAVRTGPGSYVSEPGSETLAVRLELAVGTRL